MGLSVPWYGIVVTLLEKEIIKLLRTACSYWIKGCRMSCRLNCTFARKVPATLLYRTTSNLSNNHLHEAIQFERENTEPLNQAGSIALINRQAIVPESNDPPHL